MSTNYYETTHNIKHLSSSIEKALLQCIQLTHGVQPCIHQMRQDRTPRLSY